MKELNKQLVVIWLLLPVLASAQDDFGYQRDFPLEEFAQRRGKVFEKIGTEAVVFLQGAPAARGFGVFRQNNDFFYLCGIEVPQTYLLLDGRSGKTAVYLRLPSRGKRSRQTADEYTSSVKKETGVDAVYGIESLLGHLENVSELYALLGSRRAKRAPRREMASVDRTEAMDLLSSEPLGGRTFCKSDSELFPQIGNQESLPNNRFASCHQEPGRD